MNKVKVSSSKETKSLFIKKLNLITLGVALMFSFICCSFIYTAGKKYHDLKQRLSKLEIEAQSKQKTINRLESLIERYNQQLNVAKELIFTRKDIAAFLGDFSGFAKENKLIPVQMKALEIKPVPTSNDSEETVTKLQKEKTQKENKDEELLRLLMLPANVKIKGEYPRIINFLTSLENYKQLLTISNVKMQISSDGYPDLETEFTLRLYTMNELN